MEVLPNGTVGAGYINGPQTYTMTPRPIRGRRRPPSCTVIRAPRRRGSSCLPDGTNGTGSEILSYNIWSSISRKPERPGVRPLAEHVGEYRPAARFAFYVSVGHELGPGFLLPDGRVFQLGGNSNTAIYTPSTGTWVAGPTVPNGWAADDASGAELPNGHVIFAIDTPVFNSPTELFDFDPTTNTITQLTSLPAQLRSDLSNIGSGVTRMLILPTGQLLLSTRLNEWVFTPTDAPIAASAPTISSISLNNDGTYTLTGTQLNGMSEGASYGDDAQMAENYPIVRAHRTTGNVYYARTFNWSSTGVATGTTPVTTQFALPAGCPTVSTRWQSLPMVLRRRR